MIQMDKDMVHFKESPYGASLIQHPEVGLFIKNKHFYNIKGIGLVISLYAGTSYKTLNYGPNLWCRKVTMLQSIPGLYGVYINYIILAVFNNGSAAKYILYIYIRRFLKMMAFFVQFLGTNSICVLCTIRVFCTVFLYQLFFDNFVCFFI